jgi:hypothetical protein
VSPVRYELSFYIPEDGILHSHRRENLKSYRSLGICSYVKCTSPKIPRPPPTFHLSYCGVRSEVPVADSLPFNFTIRNIASFLVVPNLRFVKPTEGL